MMHFRLGELSDADFIAPLIYDTDPSHFEKAFGKRAIDGIVCLASMNSPINHSHITLCAINEEPVAIFALYSPETMNELVSEKPELRNFPFGPFGLRLFKEYRVLQKAMSMSIRACQRYLGMISVKREFRSVGYGRAILDSLDKTGFEVVLDVSRRNRKALSIYAKCGFRPETELPPEYPLENSVRLKRPSLSIR